MKQVRRTLIALILTLMLIVSSIADLTANAAEITTEQSGASVTFEASGISWPSGYVTAYTLSNGRVNTYSDAACTKYTGYISGNVDLCKIINFNKTYMSVKVEYPTAKGKKQAYCKLSNFVYNVGFATKTMTLTKQYKVFTKSDLRQTIGTAYKGDKIIIVSTKGDLTQFLYPIGSTGNNWKLGWCRLDTPAKTYYVTASKGLNLRKGASEKYGIILTMPYAAAVSVSSISNGWCKATYNGTTGYCSASYLSTTKPVPKPDPTPNPTPNTNKTLSGTLYNNNAARLTCGFDGYTITKGRHEGIDFKCRLNAPIYSLTDGVIVRVAYGKTGSSGLSTIAIYNSSTNKTVIYLHSAPVSGLYAGKTIKKGDKIGVESWRGVSSSSGSHTHVEVRNGRQGYASKSVNDYKLDNPNPTSFWNSLGYTVK